MISRFFSVTQGCVAFPLLILAACSAQTRTPAALTVPVPNVVAGAPAGRLAGTVTEVTSDAPISGVEIIVHAPVLDGPRLTTTNSDGHYEVGGLPSGTFTVSARHQGYVQTGFAFRPLQGTQGTIVLGGGVAVQREELDIRLTKESSVSGRILDLSGGPVAGATVTVLRPLLHDGQHVLRVFGSTRTDTDGRYRIAGLLQGAYYVTAFEPTPIRTTTEVSGHSPTYYAGYAGSADAAGARRVDVSRAAAVTGIEFVVQRVPWVRIVGQVRRAQDARLRSGAIILQPNDAERLSPGPQFAATWLPDDQFVFEQVPPGDYIIRAMGESSSGSAMLFAEYPITVAGRDMDGVELTLVRGATLSGRVLFSSSQGTRGPDVTHMRITAPLEDGSKFGGEPKGIVQSNGRFHVVGVDAGLRLIRAKGVPAPWSLERVLRDGVDITDTPTAVHPRTALRDVELIFTDAAPSVSGLVRTCAGQRIVDGLVVVFPLDRSLWRPGSRYIHSTRTDWDGYFDIRSVPPGQYQMAVVIDFEEPELFERDTLDQLSRRAISISLSQGQRHMQDLTGDKAGGPCSPVPF